MSGFTPIVFALVVSTGVVFQLGISSATFHQFPNYPLLFAASVTFFLATIQLPFLLLANSTISTVPLSSAISVRFINCLSLATMIASFTTLLPNFNETPHWEIVLAICSGLICFVISMLCKFLLPGYRHCLRVAFLALCVAFAGLYTGPFLLLLLGTIKDNSIIHVMNCIYHFCLLPLTFVLGTILVIISITLRAELPLPFGSVTFKEGIPALTLAVGLTTLIIGASLWVYRALVNFAAGGLEAT